MIGKVVMFNSTKGYGFVSTSDGNDIFFHRSHFLDLDRNEIEIKKGMELEYDIETSDRGKHAANIRIIK